MPTQQTTRPDRFEAPRGCVTSLPGGGTSFMGLPDRNGKQILKHSFEAGKAAKSSADLTASMEVPCGPRHDGHRNFDSKIQQKRMNYNDWKPPDKDPSREHLTSTDNPLRALNIIPQPQAVEPPHAIKTYPRNTHMGTMSHIEPGTMNPYSKAQIRAARASANRASQESSPACSPGKLKKPRPQGKQADGGEGQEGAIEEGSDEEKEHEKEEEEGYEESEGGEGAYAALDSSEREVLRIAMLKEVADEIAMVKEVEDKLIHEYPHGVPRIVIKRLQEQLGVRLPSLGFGTMQSLSDKMVKASVCHP